MAEKKKIKKKDKNVTVRKGRILNYRQGRHTIYHNQLILDIGSESKEKANRTLGKKVIFTTVSGKQIHGVISRVHGNKGRVIARFTKGLPGQALGKTVKIIE